MENRYYLAIDIGASSGRHILAQKKDGRIVLEEIYRFPNGMQEHNGHKVWNVDQLFGEIQTGMKKCADIGKIVIHQWHLQDFRFQVWSAVHLHQATPLFFSFPHLQERRK